MKPIEKKKSKFVTTRMKKLDYRRRNISKNLTRKNHEKKFMVIDGRGVLFKNGWWKVPAKSPPLAPPTTGPLICTFFLKKKREKMDIKLLLHVLRKLHKYQFYKMISVFFQFFNKILGVTLMFISKLVIDDLQNKEPNLINVFGFFWDSVFFCFIACK